MTRLGGCPGNPGGNGNEKNKLFTWIIPVLLAVNLCATGGMMIYLFETHTTADITDYGIFIPGKSRMYIATATW